MEKQTIETKPAQAGCGWRVILQTPRLFLREMTEQDFDALYGILGDSDIMQHYPYIFDEKRVRGWIRKTGSATVCSASACGPFACGRAAQ